MIRYKEMAGVFRATIPLGAPMGEFPPERNFIDRHVFAKLRTLGLPPSGVCDDGMEGAVEATRRMRTKRRADRRAYTHPLHDRDQTIERPLVARPARDPRPGRLAALAFPPLSATPMAGGSSI